jgi:hypothetical protein
VVEGGPRELTLFSWRKKTTRGRKVSERVPARWWWLIKGRPDWAEERKERAGPQGEKRKGPGKSWAWLEVRVLFKGRDKGVYKIVLFNKIMDDMMHMP